MPFVAIFAALNENNEKTVCQSVTSREGKALRRHFKKFDIYDTI